MFDARIASVARQFEDFRDAERSSAILTCDSVEFLVAAMHVSVTAFAAEWAAAEAFKANSAQDRFGRQFTPAQICVPPFHAVKVTGALFHTQGGLAIDTVGRVMRKDGTVFPNLYAAGGAAAGVSGSTAAGYLSGNGLLTATVLGHLAGQAAAARGAFLTANPINVARLVVKIVLQHNRGKGGHPRIRGVRGRIDPQRTSARISCCSSETGFSPLYGAFLVKKFKQSGALFFDRQFLCSTGCNLKVRRFLSSRASLTPARRSVQSWPSYQPCSMLRPRQAIP